MFISYVTSIFGLGTHDVWVCHVLQALGKGCNTGGVGIRSTIADGQGGVERASVAPPYAGHSMQDRKSKTSDWSCICHWAQTHTLGRDDSAKGFVIVLELRDVVAKDHEQRQLAPKDLRGTRVKGTRAARAWGLQPRW